jgi:Icc-related predicted phosphoesterase
MKITLISDTHTKHEKLKLPGGDLLIHAGDVSSRGYTDEIGSFLKWFAAQQYKHKIFISGNHDFFFERQPKEIVDSLIPEGVIYLNDSGCEVEGIKIWGSPVQPWFYDWAFNRKRGADIKKHWDLIPDNTEILITHGPPHDVLDQTVHGDRVGCTDLLDAVKRIKPKLHVFGHIHEAHGHKLIDGVDFYNASVLDENYLLVNDPWRVEWNV